MQQNEQQQEKVLSPAQRDYWTYHIALLRILRALGMRRLPVSTRLELFKIRTLLHGAYPEMTDDQMATVTELIDRMVALRVSGNEPPHEDGKYV